MMPPSELFRRRRNRFDCSLGEWCFGPPHPEQNVADAKLRTCRSRDLSGRNSTPNLVGSEAALTESRLEPEWLGWKSPRLRMQDADFTLPSKRTQAPGRPYPWMISAPGIPASANSNTSIDTLKIDRRSSKIQHRPQRKAIVSASLSSRTRWDDVVAEGVETHEELAIVKSITATNAGLPLQRPVPVPILSRCSAPANSIYVRGLCIPCACCSSKIRR